MNKDLMSKTNIKFFSTKCFLEYYSPFFTLGSSGGRSSMPAAVAGSKVRSRSPAPLWPAEE